MGALTAAELRCVRRLHNDQENLPVEPGGFPAQLTELEVGNFTYDFPDGLLPLGLRRLVIFTVPSVRTDARLMPRMLPHSLTELSLGEDFDEVLGACLRG